MGQKKLFYKMYIIEDEIIFLTLSGVWDAYKLF